MVPGYPRLQPLAEDFWPLFWKLYHASRAPDAGNLKRPWQRASARSILIQK
jgi:hypothetical protein